MQGLTRRRFRDVTWYVPAGQEGLLDWLENLGKSPDGIESIILKKGRRKSFSRLGATIGGNEVYLKTFRLKGILQRLKYWLLKSKALKELEVSLVARERGVPVVLPMAAGEKRRKGFLQESYLLIQRLPEALDLLEYLRMHNITPRNKARIIEALGRLARKVHDKGILQEDFALNNFLLANTQDTQGRQALNRSGTGQAPDLTGSGQVFLIDFERSRVRHELSTKEREWTLAKLNRIGADFTLADKFRFLRAYCDTREEFECLPRWERLEKYTHQILESDARRIAAASVKGGRGYKLHRDDRLTCYFREGHSLEELLSLVQTRQELHEEHRGQFKVLRHRGQIGKGKKKENVLIYEFVAPQKGIALAKRAWQVTNGLLKAYFPVNPAMAAMEWTQKEGYRGTLMLKELKKTEDIRDCLLRFFQPAKGQKDRSTKRYSILWHTARFLSRLHNFGTFDYGILPGDISLIKVPSGLYKPFLTQPYNFAMKRRMEYKDREADLQRLEDYLQGILTTEERDYFREHYLRYSKIIH